MEAPAGLKITSPQDFQEMRSGFSRADPVKKSDLPILCSK
jgi:hypothetical protein